MKREIALNIERIENARSQLASAVSILEKLAEEKSSSSVLSQQAKLGIQYIDFAQVKLRELETFLWGLDA